MRALFASVILLISWLSLPAQSFTEVSLVSGVDHMYRASTKMGGGAAFFDYDGDGDEDLYVTGGLDGDRLYANDGTGVFSDVTAAAGLSFVAGYETMGVVTGDLDNDGDRELLVTTAEDFPNLLLRNEGNGTFTDITQSCGLLPDSSWSTSATLADYDQDGLLDIYVINYVLDIDVIQDSIGNAIGFDPTCLPNFLYHNDGNLSFSNVSDAMMVADTGCGLAVTFTDHDRDRQQAIFIANDHGQWHEPNKLFEYPGSGPFNDLTVPTAMDARMYGMGIATGDFDHDRDLDYYVTNIGANGLFVQQANGTFSDSAAWRGVLNDSVSGWNTTGWGTAFFDYDNDTWQDLYVCNGEVTVLPFIQNATEDPDKLYKNDGSGAFTDVTMATSLGDSGRGRGMAYADYDADGDLDLAVVVIHWDTLSGTHTLLYRNDLSNSHHYLQISLEGTLSNRDAYGTLLEITVGGDRWLHEVSCGGSHLSQHSAIAHFGLGTATSVDQLDIYWPNGGHEVYTGLPVDTLLHIREDSSQFVGLSAPLEGFSVHPNPGTGHFVVRHASSRTRATDATVTDMQGRIVHRQLLSGAAEWPLDLRGLAPGMYLLRIGQDRRRLLIR